MSDMKPEKELSWPKAAVWIAFWLAAAYVLTHDHEPLFSVTFQQGE